MRKSSRKQKQNMFSPLGYRLCARKRFPLRGRGALYIKTILTGLFLVSVLVAVQARYFATQASAAPTTLNFQARLLNASGGLVADGDYNVEFKLYDSAAAGASAQGACSLNSSSDDCWWLETRSGANKVRVKNGYFSVNLGSVTAFSANVPWSSDLWLSMNIGGTPVSPVWDGEMSPRIKLTAVPYAFEADKLDGIDSSGFAQLAPSTIQNVNSALAALAIDQTGSGLLLDLRGNGTSAFSLDKTGNASLSQGLTLGTSTSTTAGTLRWTGTDFEGYDGTSWKSLTAGSGITNPIINKTKTISEVQNNTVNPTAALQPDDQLFFSVGANETWNYRFYLQITGNATPDIKFSVTAPVGATCVNSVSEAENALAVGNLGCGVSSGAVPMSTATDVFEVAGTVTNGATAGIVTLNWAQNTANAANTTVLAGSFIEAQRSVGGSGIAQAFIQGGNSFGALAVIGTNDANDLSIVTNGVERLRVNSAGNLSIAGLTTFNGNLVAAGSATGTTGTTSGSGTNSTTLTLAADSFNVNDIVFIDNVTQDYYTRITADPGTGTYTVSPAVSFTNGRTVTKYNVQNIGATSTDYTSQANRFFQGYFLGGIVVGAGSTHISDGSISRTEGDLVLTPGTGGIVNVTGTLNATALTGDASGLTNINTAAIDGSTLTGLNASNISSGTLSDGLLSSNVALLSGTSTFTGVKTFDAGLTITTGQNLTINGDNLSDLTGNGLINTAGALSVSYGSVANTAVQGNTTLTCASGSGNLSGGGDTITLGSGGTCSAISILGSPSFAGTVTATDFSGGGASLTSLNASSISSGTLADGRLSTNVALLTDSQSFSGAKTFGAGLNITTGQTLTVNGDGLTDLTGTGLTNAAGALSVAYGSAVGTAVQGNTSLTITAGAGLSGGGSITLGAGGSATLSVAYGSAANTAVQGNITLVCPSGTGNLSGGGTSITLGAGGTCGGLAISNSPSFSGSVSASSFSGDGSSLTALSGTNITSGTISDLRLSANVSLLNATQTYSALKTYSAGLSITGGTTPLSVASGGVSYLTVDTAGALVRVGPTAGDTTGILLVLDTKTNAGDPTGVNGGQYYNSASGKFRCYEGGQWKDCLSETSLNKAANQTVTNNAAFQNDTVLVQALAANTSYSIDATISYMTTSNTADFKYTFTVPTGATVSIYTDAATSATTNTICNITVSGQTCSILNNANYRGIINVKGVVTTAATAGNLQFQFAQNTATAGQSVTIYAGSNLSWRKP